MIILLIAVSVVLTCSLVVAILGCIQCFVGKKARGFSNFQNPDEEAPSTSRENAGFSLEPSDIASAESQDSELASVLIEPLPDILSKTVSTSALRPRIRCNDKLKRDSSVRLITVHHPFPRVQLTYLKEIGSTWFGQVIESDAERIITGVSRNRVIVKVLSDNATNVEQKQFLEDVASFRELDHTNIIRLLGQCTETTPLLMILEFAPLGDLKAYLRNHKVGTPLFNEKNLQLKFALDVASGLACLHKHNYIHNDLATRTCLVTGDQTVKIGDYGICEERYKTDYFNNGQELLPLRWMAPETLELQDITWQITEITQASNIWSYGVLLWELMTYATVPYTALPDEQVLDGVIKQKLIKLQPPSDTNIPHKDRIFEVMQFCWLKPEQRPTVEEVHGLLQRLYKQSVSVSENSVTDDEFEKKWDSLIPKEVQIPKQHNIPVTSIDSHKFESDFTSSNENPALTKSDDSVKREKLSTTVNGGLDFTPALRSDSSTSTPFKPIRKHLTSTPLNKDKNYDKNSIENKHDSIEAIMKSEDVTSMNDSAIEDDAFENNSKPDDNRQAETLATSVETVTSGVVTGDFSLSGKHSDQLVLSTSLPGPEIQSYTKDVSNSQQPQYENTTTNKNQPETTSSLSRDDQSSLETTNDLVSVESELPNSTKDSFDIVSDLSTENLISSDNLESTQETTNQTEQPDMSDNIDAVNSPRKLEETSNKDAVSDSPDDIESITKPPTDEQEFKESNKLEESAPEIIIEGNSQLSTHDSVFDNTNKNNFLVPELLNPTSADIDSTLGADIDEFLNASFNNSPLDKSVDKSLTDFSELDAILNNKLDLTNSIEEQNESNVEHEGRISPHDKMKTPEQRTISPNLTEDSECSQEGKLENNECNPLPILSDKRLDICDIKSSTPVNNYGRYSRKIRQYDLNDDSRVNGTCSPVVNVTSETSSSQSDDDTSSTSGSSYICDYSVNDIEECDQIEKVKVDNSINDYLETGCIPFSMNDEQIQFASELYLSKGMNSPSIFERTTLETIPEDDLPASPKRVERNDVKNETHFEDVFPSQDNFDFEWDDFMGESLVGRPRSTDMSPKRALDFSDWMVEDDNMSLKSNSSALSYSKNINGVRGSTRSDFNSADSCDNTSNLSSVSDSEVKRTQPQTKPRSYISEIIANRSTGSLTSNFKNHYNSSFYSLYDNLDLDDSTTDDFLQTDLNISHESRNLQSVHVSNGSKNKMAAYGTNQVFEPTIMTTDLDEDLPPFNDLMTDISGNTTSTIIHNSQHSF
ncbi:hypothetical protein LOTGIDRAFT_156660 [Lottia gigantea]|uniref:Protein kinase domain-containing protein n=1 Tax=Lottia gigantea TaxID=225164 RepID=V4CNS0_LOTGI|nr:hypothetical protein LOTGIDRAFT_156660 [Lottia gigantea]ESP04050.1 hypothetical protein LOTGIDRAFT_156660 [Lottia gigantea]